MQKEINDTKLIQVSMQSLEHAILQDCYLYEVDVSQVESDAENW